MSREKKSIKHIKIPIQYNQRLIISKNIAADLKEKRILQQVEIDHSVAFYVSKKLILVLIA